MEDGTTGYVVDSLEEAICRIGSVLALDRAQVRRRVEQRFTAERMAQDYLKVYSRLIGREPVGERTGRIPDPSWFTTAAPIACIVRMRCQALLN